jgi:RNA polymerase sigma-70 factor, ECF subfamily
VADTPQDLARRIRAGDPDAEHELVETYGKPVRLLLERQTRRKGDAEDLYQDTFRIALEKLRAGELRDAAKLPGFVARIARNLAIEHYRKGDRRRTEADSETAEASAVPSTQLGRLLQAERMALVRQVLRELPQPRDREVLYRFYIAEEERDDLARDLGLTVLQLNRVLHRARNRYQALLEGRYNTLVAAQSALVWWLAMLPTLSLWLSLSTPKSGLAP